MYTADIKTGLSDQHKQSRYGQFLQYICDPAPSTKDPNEWKKQCMANLSRMMKVCAGDGTDSLHFLGPHGREFGRLDLCLYHF